MGIQDYFENLKKQSQRENKSQWAEGDQSKGPRIIRDVDLCRKMNFGTLTVRPVQDTNGQPMRLINHLYEAWFSKENVEAYGLPARRFSICPTMNFKKLTPDQEKLINSIIKIMEHLVDDWDTLYKGKFPLDYSPIYNKELAIFYGKSFRLTDPKGTNLLEEPGMHLFRHRAGNFYKSYTSWISQKSESRGNSYSWLEKLFSREMGTHKNILTIQTSRPKFFQVTFDMEDSAMEYQLTADDLAFAENLDKEIVDVQNFDFDYYKKWYDAIAPIVKKILEEAKREEQITTRSETPVETTEVKVDTKVEAPKEESKEPEAHIESEVDELFG